MKRLPIALFIAGALAWCACSETGTTKTVDTNDSVPADTVQAVLTVDTTLLADLPLNEVTGPVREIVTINDYGSDTLRFDSVGYIVSEILEARGIVEGHPTWAPFARRGSSADDDIDMKVTRDQQGLMQAWDLAGKVKYTFTWKDGKLESFTSEMGDEDGARTETGEYTYDAAGNALTYKATISYGTPKGRTFEETYSDYKFDDRGNWISRKVSQHNNSYTVTRKIEYYPE